MYYARSIRLCLLLSALLSGCALIGYDLGGGDSNGNGSGDGGVSVLPPSSSGGGGAGNAGSSSATGNAGIGGNAGTSGNAGNAGSGNAGDGPGDGGVDASSNDAGDGGPSDTCLGVADGTPCDDGLFCTVGETCADELCGAGAQRDCSALDDDLCLAGRCMEESDECMAKPIADGTSCGLGLACFEGNCLVGQACPTGTDCNFGCAGPFCSFDCTVANSCTIGCSTDTSCDVDCADGNDCSITCNDTNFCRVDCTGATDCGVTCAAGALCAIDCTGSVNCDAMICAQDATCVLHCGTNFEDCDFLQCSGGVTLCPDNVHVCNGDCADDDTTEWWPGRGW